MPNQPQQFSMPQDVKMPKRWQTNPVTAKSQNWRFERVTPAEFHQYACCHPDYSFLQTPEIGQLRKYEGWISYYLAVKDDTGDILAATLMLSKTSFLGKAIFYAPGGPLIDYEDTALVIFFFRHLRRFVKDHGGYLLRIAPNYQRIERDRNGSVVEGGFDHSGAEWTLRRLRFHPTDYTTQPKYLFVLDLSNRTSEELLMDLKGNTRNHIRKTEKMNIKVRELSRDELGVFKNITAATADRRGFADHPLGYYEAMFDLFNKRGAVKFLIAESDDGIPLSVAMFMLCGEEVVYLFSGSDAKYMKTHNAQYAIQWHMLQYAIKHGFKRYNFYGIGGLPDGAHSDGVYEFKKGFGGHVVELLGTYECAVCSLVYWLHRVLSWLKRLWSRVR